jgi:arsenate reductase (glutaredoxin)
MIVYIYSKCSTCQKALRFLENNKIEESITVREITKTPPSIEELKRMLKFQNENLKKLFNTSGQLYRELQLNEKLKDMTIDEALTLLNTHGMLVKRPFLIGKDFGLTGFKEGEWKNALY